jgi:hypothetical protein
LWHKGEAVKKLLSIKKKATDETKENGLQRITGKSYLDGIKCYHYQVPNHA